MPADAFLYLVLAAALTFAAALGFVSIQDALLRSRGR